MSQPITDSGANTIKSCSSNWADGNIETMTGNTSSETQVYADGLNAYTISATATDEDGTYSANTVSVSVQNVAPTLTISGAGSRSEERRVGKSRASTDPGADTITRWSINGGDGNLERVTGNPGS